jgi:hypothetical protein
MEDDFEFEEQQGSESPFHIEVDLHETGDYSRLMVVPCNESYVVIHGDEHLCTLIHTCKEVECWEQEDGYLEQEDVEKIGAAIKSYTPY